MIERLRVPARVGVLVEIPRGGVIKRRSDGSIDFVSPLPSPFNYGSVPGTMAPDGDPLDALVLGARLPRGTQVEHPVLAIYGFIDRGALDPKLVCGPHPLRPSERRRVEQFFSLYTQLKRAIQRIRQQPEPTEAIGWLPWTSRLEH